MSLVSKIKCAIAAGKDLEGFYNKQSSHELSKRRQTISRTYFIQVLIWLTALGINLFLNNWDTPLIILFSGTVISIVILLYTDFRKRIKIIEGILKERR